MTAKGILNFSDVTPECEETPVAADRLVAGTPMQRTENVYTSKSETFFSGFWSSDIGKWRVNYEGEEEFCQILDGVIELADEAGNKSRFIAGDRFTIASGFKGTWETLEPCRKHYVIALVGN